MEYFWKEKKNDKKCMNSWVDCEMNRFFFTESNGWFVSKFVCWLKAARGGWEENRAPCTPGFKYIRVTQAAEVASSNPRAEPPSPRTTRWKPGLNGSDKRIDAWNERGSRFLFPALDLFPSPQDQRFDPKLDCWISDGAAVMKLAYDQNSAGKNKSRAIFSINVNTI